jgi:formylglycine-generating enzyme required for sulfatase activity
MLHLSRIRSAGNFNKKWWTGLAIDPDHHLPYAQTPEIPNHPAQYVSWYQAMAFCNWLSQQLKYPVRLPTEWEWVQAATGGHAEYLYPWGPTWDPDRANHRQALYRLMSVGMYPQGKSPVGAFDMSGNMYEWCLNEYDDPTNVEPGSTKPHTTRGGAFFTMPGIDEVQEQLSVRHRLRDNPNGMRDDGRRLAVCIRLVCDNPPPDTVLSLPLAPP